MDRFEEELGTYVGNLTTVEAFKAMSEHTPGEWIIELFASDGSLVWHKNGFSWYAVEGEGQMMMAISSRTEQGAGNPALFVDATVLAFAKAVKLMGECEQYTGGLVFKFEFGDYAGHTLKMLTWHGVQHVTGTGDVAPGFGALTVEGLEEIEDDEDDGDDSGE